MKRLCLCVLPLVLALWAGGVAAQDALRIAAVVNDKVISVYDLNMRLAMVVAFAGLPDSAETRRRLAPQVLRTLIDDELKRQEAARLKVSVTEGEVRNTIRNMEKSNGLQSGGLDTFLKRRGIDKTALTKQIEADIAWAKMIGGRYGRIVQVGDEEIDEVLAEVEKNKGKPEHLVSEILLPVDRPENEGEILALANRLIEQVRAGASFASLARNFSKGPTAERGGDLGWNRLGQLGSELDEATVRMLPGQLSPPIRTVDGYSILFLRDRRMSTGLAGSETPLAVVNLQQLFLPLEKGASPAEVAAGMEAAMKISEKAKSCEDLDAVAKKIGSPMSGNLGDVKISSLAPQQRTLVRSLPPLKASQPLRTGDGIVVLMVCRRDQPESAGDSRVGQREKIADRLMNERLSMAARQHLRDLRRTSFVDIRL
ncbi:MAG: peptidylprolyl isomerase [Rhodospirillales bacterium]